MMTLFRYFKSELPCKSQANEYLTIQDIESANKKVKFEISIIPMCHLERSYVTYTAEERAIIGRYSSQHGPTAASWYFTKKFGCLIPEASARRFKKEYLLKLKENVGTTKAQVEIKELPIKRQGRPLLLQEGTDQAVQEYVKSLRSIGTTVNTCIVMAAAEAIICTRHPGYLQEQGGSFVVTKTWAKLLLIWMIKPKSASWLMSSIEEIRSRPPLAINGFRHAGITNAVQSLKSTEPL